MASLIQQTTRVVSHFGQQGQRRTHQLLDRLGGVEILGPLAARVLLGLFFVYFGMQKFMNYSDTVIYMSSMGVPGLLLPLVLAIEIGAGLALLIGWRIRLFAMILTGFTILASLIFHTDFTMQVQSILFMKNMAITGGLLLLAALGDNDMSMARKRKVKQSGS